MPSRVPSEAQPTGVRQNLAYSPARRRDAKRQQFPPPADAGEAANAPLADVEVVGRAVTGGEPAGASRARRVDSGGAEPFADVDELISACEVQFAGVNLASLEFRERAKFARVDARDESMHELLAQRLALLLDNEWQVDERFGRPTVVISVAGSQDDFNMSPRMRRALCNGLIRAAQTTNAWIFTGGLAAGVDQHVGEALASHPDIACIGMPLYGDVLGREALAPRLAPLEHHAHHAGSGGARERERFAEYMYGAELNALGEASRVCALEPHHSHIIAVDLGRSGRSARKRARAFAFASLLAYCRHDAGVPAAVLLVHGDGSTLAAAVDAVQEDVPVVVLADSGGASAAIADYFTRSAEHGRTLELHAAHVRAAQESLTKAQAEEAAPTPTAVGARAGVGGGRRAVRRARQALDAAHRALHEAQRSLLREADGVRAAFSGHSSLALLDELHTRRHLVHVHRLEAQSTDGVARSLLLAVTRSPKLPEMKKLELAVVWNNLEMLGMLISSGAALRRAGSAAGAAAVPDSTSAALVAEKHLSMYAALQLALELQRHEAVALLLSNGARVSAVSLARLYNLRERNPFRTFAGLQAKFRRAMRREAAEGGGGAVLWRDIRSLRRAGDSILDPSESSGELASTQRLERLFVSDGRYLFLTRFVEAYVAPEGQVGVRQRRAERGGERGAEQGAQLHRATTAQPSGLRRVLSSFGRTLSRESFSVRSSAGANRSRDDAGAGDGERQPAIAVRGFSFAGLPRTISRALSSRAASAPSCKLRDAETEPPAAQAGAGSAAEPAGATSAEARGGAPTRRGSGGSGGGGAAADGADGAAANALGRTGSCRPRGLSVSVDTARTDVRVAPLDLESAGGDTPPPTPPAATPPPTPPSATPARTASATPPLQGVRSRSGPSGPLPRSCSASPAPGRGAAAASAAMARLGFASPPPGRGGGGARPAPPGRLLRHQQSMLTRFEHGTRIDDVFFWAVLMGDQALATALWRFSRRHIRLALLASDTCRRMMSVTSQGRKHAHEIAPMAAYWEGVATEVLEEVRPAAKDRRTVFEVAERVLLNTVGGAPAVELALKLGAKTFNGHRSCQLITARSWAGVSRTLRLRLEDDNASHGQVITKMLLPFEWADDCADMLGLSGWIAKVMANRRGAARASMSAAGSGARLRLAHGDSDEMDRLADSVVAFGGDADDDDADDDDDDDDDSSADASSDGSDAESDVGRLRKRQQAMFWHVYSIPAIKFWARAVVTNGGSTLLLVLLVTSTRISMPHALSEWPHMGQGTLEGLLGFWVLGLALDFAEARGRRTRWMARTGLAPVGGQTLEPMQLLILFSLLVVRALYLSCAALGLPGWWRANDSMTEWIFPVLVGAANLSCFYRFLIETLLVFQQGGLLVITAGYMVRENLLQWLVVMALVLCAFGLAFTAIIANYPYGDDECEATSPWLTGQSPAPNLLAWALPMLGVGREEVPPAASAGASAGAHASAPDAALAGVCERPVSASAGLVGLWALFGEFDPTALEQTRPVAPLVLLVVLLVICQILLLNLLIALMAETVATVLRNAAIEWKYQFAVLVDYYRAVVAPMPPPFNLLELWWRLGAELWLRLGRALRARPDGGRIRRHRTFTAALRAGAQLEKQQQQQPFSDSEAAHATQDEIRAFHAYVRRREERERAQTGARFDSLQRVADGLDVRQMEERDATQRAAAMLDEHVRWARERADRVPDAPIRRARGGAGPPAARARLHTHARSEAHPRLVGKRAHVPDARVPWEEPFPLYEPVEFTAAELLSDAADVAAGRAALSPWEADPPDAPQIDFSRRFSAARMPIALSAVGRPLNPHGRTGTAGRGVLPKWGPNHGVTALFARFEERSGTFRALVVRTPASSMWGLPSGLVAFDEQPAEEAEEGGGGKLPPRRRSTWATAALADASQLHGEALEELIDLHFGGTSNRPGRHGKEVPGAAGYVDDERNTDHAWVEATVRLFVVGDDPVGRLPEIGDRRGSEAPPADALFQWVDVDRSELARGSVGELRAETTEYLHLARPLLPWKHL